MHSFSRVTTSSHSPIFAEVERVRNPERAGAQLDPKFKKDMYDQKSAPEKRKILMNYMKKVEDTIAKNRGEKKKEIAAADRSMAAEDFETAIPHLIEALKLSNEIITNYEVGKNSVLHCRNSGGGRILDGKKTTSDLGKKFNECRNGITEEEKEILHIKAKSHYASMKKLSREIQDIELQEKQKGDVESTTDNSSEASTPSISDSLVDKKFDHYQHYRDLTEALRKLPPKDPPVITKDHNMVAMDAFDLGNREVESGSEAVRYLQKKCNECIESHRKKVSEFNERFENALNAARNAAKKLANTEGTKETPNLITASGEEQSETKGKKESSVNLFHDNAFIKNLLMVGDMNIEGANKMAEKCDAVVTSIDKWISYSKIALENQPKGKPRTECDNDVRSLSAKYKKHKRICVDESQFWMCNAFNLLFNKVFFLQRVQPFMRNNQNTTEKNSKELDILSDHCVKNLGELATTLINYTNFLTKVQRENAKSHGNLDPDVDKDHKMRAYSYLNSLLPHFNMAYKYATQLADKFEERGSDADGSNEMVESYRNVANAALSLSQRTEIKQHFASLDLEKLKVKINEIPKYEHERVLETLNWDFVQMAKKAAPEEDNEEDAPFQERTSGTDQASSSSASRAQAEQAGQASMEMKILKRVKTLEKDVRSIEDKIKKQDEKIEEWIGYADDVKKKNDKISPGNRQEDRAYFLNAQMIEDYMHLAADCRVTQADRMNLLEKKIGNLKEHYEKLIDSTKDVNKVAEYAQKKIQCEKDKKKIKESLPDEQKFRQEADYLRGEGTHRRIVSYVKRPSQKGFEWLADNGYIAVHDNAAPQYLPDPKRNKRGFLEMDQGGDAIHDHVLQYEVRATDVRQAAASPGKDKDDDSLKFYIHYHYKEDVYKQLQDIYEELQSPIHEVRKRLKGKSVKNGVTTLQGLDKSELQSTTQKELEKLQAIFENIKENPLHASDYIEQCRRILEGIATGEISDAVKERLETNSFKKIEDVTKPLEPFKEKEANVLRGFDACDFKRAGEELMSRGNHSWKSEEDEGQGEVYRRHTDQSNFQTLYKSIQAPHRLTLAYHPKRRERASEASQ